MVGGKVVALNASLAREWITEPVGTRFNFEDQQIEWIGKPFSEEGKNRRRR